MSWFKILNVQLEHVSGNRRIRREPRAWTVTESFRFFACPLDFGGQGGEALQVESLWSPGPALSSKIWHAACVLLEMGSSRLASAPGPARKSFHSHAKIPLPIAEILKIEAGDRKGTV